MKNYRIGELSKYLGVTPDFIKYYEKEGLITSIPETSPKLYPFNQSSKILECIKLKNLGFTAKEMQDYLFSDTLKDYRETKQELDYETRKNIAFIKEIDDYQRWIKTYKNDPLPYALQTVDSFYFLKHTSFSISCDFWLGPPIGLKPFEGKDSYNALEYGCRKYSIPFLK